MTMQKKTTGIREAEDALFAEWQEAHKASGLNEFVRDGVVDEDAYLRSERKLLFVLKEVNSPGEGGGGWDLRDFLKKGCVHESKGKGRRPCVGEYAGKWAMDHDSTWTNIARWAEGLRRLSETIPWKEIEQIGIGDEGRRPILRSIAAMNQKKVPGGNTAIKSEVGRFAFNDRVFLSKQISLYHAPDLIICCGVSLANNLHEHVPGWKDKPWKHTSNGCLFFEYEDGKHVVDYKHPAPRFGGHQKLYENLIAAVREITCQRAAGAAA